jgi:Protein of unknown function (DUF1698)
VQPKDDIDRWILAHCKGNSFVDIGGIGVDSCNERVSIAAFAGANRTAIADIQPADHWEWAKFREKMIAGNVGPYEVFEEIDLRSRQSTQSLDKFDVVHSTGILYHVQSPAEVLWNLKCITGKKLITNTVIIPNKISNSKGTLETADHSVLFTAALRDKDRAVLNQYYQEKFGWTIDQVAPPLDRPNPNMEWIQNGELTCWPYWYLYTANAFRSLVRLCGLRILDEWLWENHTLQVLCEPV